MPHQKTGFDPKRPHRLPLSSTISGFTIRSNKNKEAFELKIRRKIKNKRLN